ncbi:MAG: hypothetical protein LBM41_02625 [Ruminococcus sp.]|jgi:hypothetical protein|nr:hypothetical protein [Ruminococcus sp.]
MKILLCGTLGSIATEFAESFLKKTDSDSRDRLVMLSDHMPKLSRETAEHSKLKLFGFSPNDKNFMTTLSAFSPDTIIYFLKRSEQQFTKRDRTGSVEDLSTVLFAASSVAVSNIIVVHGGEDLSPKNHRGSTDYEHILDAAQRIITSYREKGMPVISVRFPYIYTVSSKPSNDLMITRTVLAAKIKNKVVLPGNAGTETDFICDLDAAALLYNISEEGVGAAIENGGTVNVTSGHRFETAELEYGLKAVFKDLYVTYNEEPVIPPLDETCARTEYSFIALHNLIDDFPIIVSQILGYKEVESRSKWYQKLSNRNFMIIEYPIVAAIAQILASTFDSSLNYGIIDIRMLFVVVTGSLYGTFVGTVSALLACVSLFFSPNYGSLDVILYNPENWVPFALYLIIGSVLGYTKDRRDEEKRIFEDEKAYLLDTNDYLSGICNEALINKENYKEQLLGYKDSFGKVFSAVRRLDNQMSEYVYSEAIGIIEDILDNETIAIYTVASNGYYARLAMKSKNLKTIDKSIKIDNLSEAKDTLLSGKVWYNSNMTPGLPSYAAPIMSGGKVVAFIFIMKAKLNQLSLYYSNIFSVLSGLVQDALVRAIKEEKAAESITYIEGTRVHCEEAFKKIYDANILLAESEKIGLSLLEINTAGGDIDDISSRLENSLRETDTIGIVSDERRLLGVQLINTVGDDLKFVLGRLTAAGIAATPVKVFSR